MTPEIANAKQVLVVNQASTTNAGTAAGTLDRLGYDFVTVNVIATTSDNVTNNPSVLKIGESDDTVVTNFTDITGYVGDTSFTVPNAITAATSITQPFATLHVDCRARKRYLRVSVSPVTTQVITILAQLTRADKTPSTSDVATVVVQPS